MARPAFWNDERDALLKQLWVIEPKLTLKEMVHRLGGGISETAVSNRGAQLGLPSRYSSVQVRLDTLPPKELPVRRRIRKRAVEFRAPKSDAKYETEAGAPPKPKPPPPLETSCPYYHGDGHVCGVMVNRRPDAHGNKPSQYCATHKKRVLPLSRGVFMGLGTPATYGRGHRFG